MKGIKKYLYKKYFSSSENESPPWVKSTPRGTIKIDTSDMIKFKSILLNLFF